MRGSNGFPLHALTLKINTHRSIQICVMVAEVQKALGACHDRTARGETGVLHGDGLGPDRIILCVEEQSHY